MSGEKRPLGKILLQRKLVSQQELERALRAQKRSATPVPLASQLVDEGAVGELDALGALSEQHGVPGLDLTQIAIVLDHLDVVPRQLAETHLVLPVLVKGDRVFLAMADPQEKRVVDELEFVTGKKAYPYVAVHSTLAKTIAAAYDAKARGELHYLGPRVPEETLRHLGLAPAPTAVMDDAVQTSSLTTEVSTSEFGVIGQEVSSAGQPPVDPAARSQRSSDVPAGAKLVLVVDDEEELRTLIARLLKQRGHRVIEADRGLLALRMVKEHLPDLIVLDAMLPELHGFDIARRIKGSAKYGHIPIVMVSAAYRGERVGADLKRNYGVEEYIEKPFRVAALLDAVQRLLGQHDGEPPDSKRDPEYLSAEAERALASGVAAYNSGAIDEAIEHLRRGGGIDPLSYRLRFHLALLLGKKGLIHEGIQELERAIDLNPRHFAALKNLAVLYEKAGFKSKAMQMWERCVSLAPDDKTREIVQGHLRALI